MNGVNLGLGLFLLVFSFVLVMNALPSLNTATQTGTGSFWENGTATQKNNIDFANGYIFILPAFVFFIGLALTIDGFIGGKG